MARITRRRAPRREIIPFTAASPGSLLTRHSLSSEIQTIRSFPPVQTARCFHAVISLALGSFLSPSLNLTAAGSYRMELLGKTTWPDLHSIRPDTHSRPSSLAPESKLKSLEETASVSCLAPAKSPTPPRLWSWFFWGFQQPPTVSVKCQN